MEKERFVKLTNAKTFFHAELIRSLLEANSIPCEIRDKGQLEIYNGAGAAMTKGIILRVPEGLLKQAEEVLQAAKEAGKLLDAESEKAGN